MSIAVVGSTGAVGSAAVKALAALTPPPQILAIARSAEKASAAFADLPTVTVAEGSATDSRSLRKALSGVSVAFLNAPPTEDRAELIIAAAAAAKAAGVARLVVMSVATTGYVRTCFGKQFLKAEAGVSSLGLPVTYIRCPLFLDNILGQAGSVASDGALYGPVKPDAPWRGVTTADVGIAVAAAATGDGHEGKTYKVMSPPTTWNDIAVAVGSAAGKDVSYVQVPYEAATEAMLGMGFPAWQADGVNELNHLIDSGDPVFGGDDDDFSVLTGHPPRTMETFVKENSGVFA